MNEGDVDPIVLYKKDRRGKMRYWSIEADEFEIRISHGSVGGEEQEVFEYIEEGLAGRTRQEQLMLKINSKLSGRLDRGYVHSIDEAENFNATNVMGLKMPMTAKSFKDVSEDSLDWDNCVLQYKYNGYRCLIHNDGERIIAYSRKGREIAAIKEILGEAAQVLEPGQTIDGELYCHGLKLQRIGSLVRKRQSETANLKFMAYDLISDSCYSERHRQLMDMFWSSKFEKIQVADTFTRGETPISKMLTVAVKQGYEGLMLRRFNYPYESGLRSHSLLKIKSIQDAEFVIVDITESKDGWAILHCICQNGKIFKVTAPGTVKEKTEIANNKHLYRGATVTVEFPELTADGKPFHPVATGIFTKEIE